MSPNNPFGEDYERAALKDSIYLIEILMEVEEEFHNFEDQKEAEIIILNSKETENATRTSIFRDRD